MGDPRNWTARKAASVRAENVAADRQRLHEVTLYACTAAERRGQLGPDLFSLHPCDTFRVFRFVVEARCMGCLGAWPVARDHFDHSDLAHRPWPSVMGELVCPRCGSVPSELRFKTEAGDVGAISTEPEVVLHVETSTSCITRPERVTGELDPGAQYDDGRA